MLTDDFWFFNHWGPATVIEHAPGVALIVSAIAFTDSAEVVMLKDCTLCLILVSYSRLKNQTRILSDG